MSDDPGYVHLNRAGLWPGLQKTGLAVGADGTLSLDPDGDSGLLKTRGWFMLGPLHLESSSTPWFRLRVDADPLTATTHLQIFTFAGYSNLEPAVPDEGAEDPFSDAGWATLPRDRTDLLEPSQPGEADGDATAPGPPGRPQAPPFWIGARLRGDGTSSPVVRQVRIDYRRETYLAHLPEVFARPDAQRDFLERFLALHESVLGGLEQAIDDLPLLLDAACAPDEADSWLTWLCGWLAFERSDLWSMARTRAHLADAFSLAARRGTIEGLRRYLKLYAGLESRIQEGRDPGRCWLLGESSTLGFSTALASGPLQGAVLGSSATLDESHLAREDGRTVLSDDEAHRFCVQVYRTPSAPRDALARARAVLDREKPAHTTYHLQMIEANLRVGVQARVGIDAVVGAPRRARLGTRLGDGVLTAALEGDAPS